MLNRFLLFAMSLCLGSLLVKLHIPIPFMLGGIIAAMCCRLFAQDAQISWPRRWRELALLVAGYGIGANFSAEAWRSLLVELSGVAEATVLIIGFSMVLAFITSRLTKEDLKSCIMGMLPGGITISMLMAEEDKDVNPNVIVVMQVIRLLSVVVTVPFLVIYMLDAQMLHSSVTMPDHGGVHWLVFVPLAVLGAFAAKKLQVPTPKLLGPILLTALFSVYMDGVQPVPGPLMAAAQVSIGLYMGMQLDLARLAATRKMIPFILLGTALMIGISILMGQVLSARYGFSLNTAFLAMAPGGIAEMALAGMSMGENVAVILTYQLARVLAINIFIPPLMVYMFKKR